MPLAEHVPRKLGKGFTYGEIYDKFGTSVSAACEKINIQRILFSGASARAQTWYPNLSRARTKGYVQTSARARKRTPILNGLIRMRFLCLILSFLIIYSPVQRFFLSYVFPSLSSYNTCQRTVENMFPTNNLVPGSLVRLADGNWIGEGRVEIFHDGAWGTICDDDWDIQDARVVCRELGFSEAVIALTHAWFGAGSGTIWLENVRCLGNESSIGNCPHPGWEDHDCKHHEDASVICSRTLSMSMKM